MNRTNLGLILTALGAALVIVSALADSLGIGGDETAFGWKQIAGIVIGAAAAAVGLFLAYAGRRHAV